MRTPVIVILACVAACPPLGAQAPRVRPIAAVRRDSLDSRRVTVAGRVTVGTGTLDSTRLIVFLQDATGGIQLFSSRIERQVRVGDSVVATGIPQPYRGLTELADARLTVIPGPRRVVPPRTIAVQQETLAGATGELVRMVGRITDARVSTAQLTLQRPEDNGGRPAFVVVMAPSAGGDTIALDRFGTGDHVDVTGVLWRRDVRGNAEPRYVLFPRSPADVRAMGVTTRQRGYLLLALIPLLPMAGVVLFRIQAVRSAGRLRLMEARFHTLYDESLDAVFVQDAEWRIQDANRAAAALTGVPVEMLRQRSLLDFFGEEGRAALAASGAELQARGHLERETRLRRQDGHVADVTLRLTVIPSTRHQRILTVVRDVTASRLLEEQLRQSQKMEAVGLLAGGVAHDFNNLLTVIGMHSEFLAAHLVRDETALEDVHAIRDAASRAADLTRQLLAFSRKQMLQPELLDINAAIVDVERMLGRLIGEDIELALELQPNVGHVLADRGQIGQVLMNLAVNARDAMPVGGRLTIATRCVDRRDFTSDEELADGAYVELTVRDNGVGMSADVRARVFEPFFTTKGQGKGTGLGLATTYGIVRQSGGHVDVESAVGKGTAFHIYLPLRQESSSSPPPREADAPTTGSETVLLVEDEEDVRGLARRVLERDGYLVLSAASGAEALHVAEQYRGRIDILVTDLVMPGLNGRELYARLRAMLGDLRVLFMSGYTDDEVIRRGVQRRDLPWLDKPFDSDRLSASVRKALDAPLRDETTAPAGRTSGDAPTERQLRGVGGQRRSGRDLIA